MSLLLAGFESLAEIGINMWLGGVGSLVSMIWLSSWNCSDKKRQHTLEKITDGKVPSSGKHPVLV